MSDPYTDQAKAMASLSAENGLLRAEIEQLRAALKPFAKMYAAPGGEMDKAIQEARRALEGK